MVGFYYSVDRFLKRPKVTGVNPDELYSTSILELGEHYIHNKSVYTIVDCLSDLGGLAEIIMVMTGILMNPIQYHSYILKAI
jgi:hypothetical protein